MRDTGKFVKSEKQLRQLTEMLKWANASDADETTDRPACYASQSGLYGSICDAVAIIVEQEYGLDYYRSELRS